jgi:hypothetical protein
MTDLKTLSDDELKALYSQKPSGNPTLSAIPDEQLVAMSMQADRSYKGSVLPFSRGPSGDLSFDSDAGVVGAMKRAFTLPHDVATGAIDPMSDQGIDRAAEMALTVSPTNPAVRIGDRAIPGAVRALKQPAKPTGEALKAAAGTGFDAVRDSGVDYSAKAVSNLATSLKMGLERDGILDTLAPKTHDIIDRLTNPPEGSVAPIAGIEAARRALGEAARDFSNPTEQKAAVRALSGLDGFIREPGEANVVSGPATTAAKLLEDARGNYAASKRSEALTGSEARYGIADSADLRASAANSGQNVGNTIRSRVAGLLTDPEKSAGFTAQEAAALEKLVRGSFPANSSRFIGNLLGGGGGLGMAAASAGGAMAGSAMGDATGAGIGAVAAPLVGAASKQISNLLTQRALSKVDEATRGRNPLYELLQQNTAAEGISPEKRSALLRLLMEVRPNQGGN